MVRFIGEASFINTMTITGTSYFPHFSYAMNYYRPYLGLPFYTGGDENPLKIKRGKDKDCYNWVADKISAGEIHIGKPPLKPGETLFIKDNRYHIQGE
jgi:hypothetical protein